MAGNDPHYTAADAALESAQNRALATRDYLANGLRSANPQLALYVVNLRSFHELGGEFPEGVDAEAVLADLDAMCKHAWISPSNPDTLPEDLRDYEG